MGVGYCGGAAMNLHYLKPHEFDAPYIDKHGKEVMKNWYDDMSPVLLTRVDVLRQQLGQTIRPTGAMHSLGRYNDSNSQHNVKRWGEVRALDCYVGGVIDAFSVEQILLVATNVGITGIGFYSFWSGGPGGFHFDVRPDREPGYPALWGAVINDLGLVEYVTIDMAVEAIGR
jgi:hypothetical protein